MLARKLLENWWLWFAADVIYVALYASSRLFLTAALYLVFLLMTIAGYRRWRATLRGRGMAPLEDGPAVA